jgi:hypothetical protein
MVRIRAVGKALLAGRIANGMIWWRRPPAGRAKPHHARKASTAYVARAARAAARTDVARHANLGFALKAALARMAR